MQVMAVKIVYFIHAIYVINSSLTVRVTINTTKTGRLNTKRLGKA